MSTAIYWQVTLDPVLNLGCLWWTVLWHRSCCSVRVPWHCARLSHDVTALVTACTIKCGLPEANRRLKDFSCSHDLQNLTREDEKVCRYCHKFKWHYISCVAYRFPRPDVPCDYPPSLKMFYLLYLSGMIVQMLNFGLVEIFNMPSVFHLKFSLRKIVCQVSPSEFWLCIPRPWVHDILKWLK